MHSFEKKQEREQVPYLKTQWKREQINFFSEHPDHCLV